MFITESKIAKLQELIGQFYDLPPFAIISKLKLLKAMNHTFGLYWPWHAAMAGVCQKDSADHSKTDQSITEARS